MGHVEDRWTRPGPTGRRVRSERHGHGKRWLAIWQEPGGVRRKQSFHSKDAAVAHLAAVDVDQRAGTYVRPTAVTVAEFGDRWITTQLHHRGSTTDQLESRWRLHIRPALGHYRIGDVTQGMVQDVVARWSATLAPATVRVVYVFASAMFRSAVDDKLIRETPCRRIRLPQIVRDPITPLSALQVRTIAERMTGIRSHYYGLVLLGAATGLRPGELRGLTVDRCVFADGVARVRVDRQLIGERPQWGPPKTPTSTRTVPTDEETARMLRRHIAEHPPHPSGLIFTNRAGRPLSRAALSDAWAAATGGMELPDRSGFHALRHFHASMLIAGGLSPVAVAARLGHKDATETIATYSHLWHDDDARSTAAVAASLWAPATPGALRLVQT